MNSLLAAEAVGQVAEEQRADDRAGEVEASRRGRLRRRSPSVSFDVSAPAIEPTSVTSSPSRIQVIPSATITIQCHRLHGSRSSRAGMSVLTVLARSAGDAERPRACLCRAHRSSFCPRIAPWMQQKNGRRRCLDTQSRRC